MSVKLELAVEVTGGQALIDWMNERGVERLHDQLDGGLYIEQGEILPTPAGSGHARLRIGFLKEGRDRLLGIYGDRPVDKSLLGQSMLLRVHRLLGTAMDGPGGVRVEILERAGVDEVHGARSMSCFWRSLVGR